MKLKSLLTVLISVVTLACQAQTITYVAGGKTNSMTLPPNSTIIEAPADVPTTGPVTNVQTFFQTAELWATSFNTNLATWDNPMVASAGVDSIQNGVVPIANSLSLEYQITISGTNRASRLSLCPETTIRDGGVQGGFISGGLGANLSYTKWDFRASAYAEAVRNFTAKDPNPWGGEIGFRVAKSLTQNTFTQIGLGLIVPHTEKIITARVGFTF